VISGLVELLEDVIEVAADELSVAFHRARLASNLTAWLPRV